MKRPISFWDLATTFALFFIINALPFRVREAAHTHGEFSDWCTARAAVYFPYAWLQTMAFYDVVNMGIPTFVPDSPIYTINSGTNSKHEWSVKTWYAPPITYPYHYADHEEYEGRIFWWHLTDFHAFNGVGRFSSVSELLIALEDVQGLLDMSAKLHDQHEQRVAKATIFWKDAVLRACCALDDS